MEGIIGHLDVFGHRRLDFMRQSIHSMPPPGALGFFSLSAFQFYGIQPGPGNPVIPLEVKKRRCLRKAKNRIFIELAAGL
jgi:hypothetical protein